MSFKSKKIQSALGCDVTLTSDTLRHIRERHLERNDVSSDLLELILKVVEDPDFVLLGKYGEHIAIRYNKELRRNLVVPFEENGKVKTAFISSKADKLLSTRKIVWKR